MAQVTHIRWKGKFMRRSKLRDHLDRVQATVAQLDDPKLSADFARLSELINEATMKRGLYGHLEGPAKIVKTAIQMLIGIGAVALLAIMVWESGLRHFPDDKLILELIAKALALAAAVELAYTLFTDGPDEAIDPLMLGLSAAALLQLAGVHEFRLSDAGAMALYAVSLGILFMVRRKFVGWQVSAT
jgi:hypothetical protein